VNAESSAAIDRRNEPWLKLRTSSGGVAGVVYGINVLLALAVGLRRRDPGRLGNRDLRLDLRRPLGGAAGAGRGRAQRHVHRRVGDG
jgi:hypothetical protein